MKNYETYQFPGGLRNRINRITMRTGGRSNASYNRNFEGQAYDNNTVIRRVTAEPPVERGLQDGVMDLDV